MGSMKAKLIVASVVLLGAIGYLSFAGIKSGWVYYMDAAAFVDDVKFHNSRVRLHGQVGETGFTSSAATLTANFNLVSKGKTVPVEYRGPIPDLFKVGGDVVVEGKLDSTGKFKADVLMTKCASKYEAKKAERIQKEQEQHQ